MNTNALQRLLDKAALLPNPTSTVFGSPVEVAAGQVRRLDDPWNPGVSLLVAVLSRSEERGTAQVVVATSPTDLASTRDLVIQSSMSGAAFPLVLLTDAIGTVWTHQLAETPQAGELPGPVVHLARKAHRMATDDLARDAQELGIQVGTVAVQGGDHLWWSQARVVGRLAAIAEPCNEARLSRPIADPGIVDAAVRRGTAEDHHAVAVLRELVQGGIVVVPPAAWDFLAGEVTLTNLSPDLTRMLGDVLMASLTGLDQPPASNVDNFQWPAGDERSAEVDLEPLERLVANRATEGATGSRIYTSAHLWERVDDHTVVMIGNQAHSIVLETEESLALSEPNWSLR